MVLISSRYGKDHVRLLKVKKDPTNPSYQDVIEITCTVLLEGQFDTSYTEADNSSVVPTDTVKNTTYIMAKLNDVWPIEGFAATLANHFVTKYPQVEGTFIDIIQHSWKRYEVNGKLHDHSFVQGGNELRVCSLHYNPGKSILNLKSGIKDLTVLKSTGSMFYGYNQCDFTTLKPTTDRILSTDIDAQWTWSPKVLKSIDDVKQKAKAGLFDYAFDSARGVTLELFALENSASVQATMYNMSEKILATVPELDTVSYSLPNKHYMNIDMSWHDGIKNTGSDAEVFLPSLCPLNPNGLIKCTVGRSKAKL